MLARPGRLPDEDGYAYEPKWDGFRAIVRCGGEFRVRSRRAWNMTSRLPKLAALPVDAVLDGELVALGDDGWPHFPLVCERMLRGTRPSEISSASVERMPAPYRCPVRKCALALSDFSPYRGPCR